MIKPQHTFYKFLHRLKDLKICFFALSRDRCSVQVTLKMKSRHVAGTVTKKKKSEFIFALSFCQMMGEELDERGLLHSFY